MTKLHLTDEQLSALVDSAIPESERALLEEHLRSCRSCYFAYQDALRYRAIWEADPAVFRAPASIAAIAHETPARAARWEARGAQKVSRGTFWRSWAPALGAAAAVVALIVAIAVWRPDALRPQQTPYAALFDPVRTAVEQASTGGSIILPGTEEVAAATVPSLRTGFAEPDPAVSRALRDLAEAYRDDRTSPEVAHWLISGFLAVGQLENARLYVEDARRRYPGDQRFITLEAIVAYRSNDMPRAERLLQAALREDPLNGVALLNLALVQYEQGQWEMARSTFEAVRNRFPGTPLEARAQALLSSLLGG